MTEATATQAKAKKRTRKSMNYALGWITETEGEKDGDDNEIPGTARVVHVLMDLPPGLDEAQARNRDAIERACHRAVYEKGLAEYGNKKFVVVTFGDPFEVPFEKTTVTRLLPPDKAAKVKAQDGNGAVVEIDTDSDSDDSDSDVAI